MNYTLLIHSGGEVRDRFNNLSEAEQKQITEEYFAIAQAPGVFGGNELHPADTGDDRAGGGWPDTDDGWPVHRDE